VPGHQKRVNFETHGNSFADETTKQAALTSEAPVFCLIPHHPALTSPLSLPPLRKNNKKQQQQQKTLGVVRTEQGKWVLPGGREMI
jgi:hypothetical protein